MKTASLPSLRVEPELRQAAEEVLLADETLSSFVEESVRRNIEFRQAQQAFIRRGLASAQAARESGRYVAADTVLDKLAQRLEQVRATSKSK